MITSVKQLFTQEFLVDILTTASYGSFWFECSIHKDTPKEIINKAKEFECREEKWACVLLNGGYVNIYDVEEEKNHKVSLEDIIRGFEIVMLNYPEIYASIRDESYDLYDADAVIQCAVFGEVVYG